MSTITLRRNGATRTIPTGYSWTTFFFGPFPSLIRMHWPFFWRVIGAELLGIAMSRTFLDLGISLVFACMLIACKRNESLLYSLLKDGWKLENKRADFEELEGTPDAVNDEGY